MRELCAEAAGDLERASAAVKELWSAVHDHSVVVKLLELPPDAARIARRGGEEAFGATVVGTADLLARRCPDSVAPATHAAAGASSGTFPPSWRGAAAMMRLRRRRVEQAFAEWEAGTIHAARRDATLARRFFANGGRDAGCDPGAVDAAGLAFGWSSLTRHAEIASRLISSRRTIESHRHHVYTKLGTSSRLALAVDAGQRLAG